MTKTLHSKIYSTESGITGGGLFKTPPLHFTKEQLEWIGNIQLPTRLFLISATEFDDRYLYLHDDWRYRFSGNNVAILFSTGNYFCDLSPASLKLLKYLTIEYINENSASVADKFSQFVATTFKQIEVSLAKALLKKCKYWLRRLSKITQTAVSSITPSMRYENLIVVDSSKVRMTVLSWKIYCWKCHTLGTITGLATKT
ncbi:TPA: hypothetical protein ACTVB3_000334 [Klebsiella aerogenes]